MGRDTFASAKVLFERCTYLGHDKTLYHQIADACMQQGYIAIVDYDSEMGWVFHSLQHPASDWVWKKAIATHFETMYPVSGDYREAA